MKLVYFSPVNWYSYAQRPHFMARYLLEHNIVSGIMWVNPYPTRLPRPSDFFRKRSVDKLEAPFNLDGLTVLNVSALPIEPLPGGTAINQVLFWKKLYQKINHWNQEEPSSLIIGVGRPTALAINFIKTSLHKACFYDAMDDFPAFYSGLSKLSMTVREKQLVSITDKLWCSAPGILKEPT